MKPLLNRCFKAFSFSPKAKVITICSKYLHNLYHTKKHIIYNLKLYITCRIQKVYKALTFRW